MQNLFISAEFLLHPHKRITNNGFTRILSKGRTMRHFSTTFFPGSMRCYLFMLAIYVGFCLAPNAKGITKEELEQSITSSTLEGLKGPIKNLTLINNSPPRPMV